MQISSSLHLTGGRAGLRRREPEEAADTSSVVIFLVTSVSNKLPITFFPGEFLYTFWP